MTEARCSSFSHTKPRHDVTHGTIKALGVHLDKSRRKAHATATRAKKVKLRVGVNARLVELEWYLQRRVSEVLLNGWRE